MTIILFVEWFAMVVSVLGSLLMSLKLGRISEVAPWCFWIVAACLFIYLFSVTGQHGMIFWQASGLLSAGIGLMSWLNQETDRGKAASIASLLTSTYILLAVLFAVQIAIEPKISTFEWLGGVLSAAAAFLMASRTAYSPFAWLFWFSGNIVLMATSYLTQQYGVLTLNAVFTATNAKGIYRWVFPKIFKKTNLSLKV